MTDSQAKQIAELLNENNQLIINYQASDILRNSTEYVFVEDSGVIVSCAQLKKVQWYQWEICHVSVRNEGHGLGKQIISIAEELAIRNGAKIIQCTIRAQNMRSVKLFTLNGYVKTSNFFYPNSGNQVNVYQKSLFNMDIT